MNTEFRPDWEALQKQGAPVRVPTRRERVLLSNSEDFAGTMIFARRSLGRALFFAEVANPNNLVDANVARFWGEYVTTLQWLNMASDRLRDYFLMAQLDKDKEQFVNAADSKEERALLGEYPAPFRESLASASPEDVDAAKRLVEIADKVSLHQTQRNKHVHQIATKAAFESHEVLRFQRETANASVLFLTLRDNV